VPLSRQKPLIVVEEIVCVFEAQEQMRSGQSQKLGKVGRLEDYAAGSRTRGRPGTKVQRACEGGWGHDYDMRTEP